MSHDKRTSVMAHSRSCRPSTTRFLQRPQCTVVPSMNLPRHGQLLRQPCTLLAEPFPDQPANSLQQSTGMGPSSPHMTYMSCCCALLLLAWLAWTQPPPGAPTWISSSHMLGHILQKHLCCCCAYCQGPTRSPLHTSSPPWPLDTITPRTNKDPPPRTPT